MPAAIRAVSLFKSYPAKPPVEAVRGIDLEVMEGECFGLLGPNGAGKTTTMEMLEGLLEPTSGTIQILNYQWGQDDAVIRCLIGISLQETRLTERQTVRETVDLFRSFYPNAIASSEAIAARFLRVPCFSFAWPGFVRLCGIPMSFFGHMGFLC